MPDLEPLAATGLQNLTWTAAFAFTAWVLSTGESARQGGFANLGVAQHSNLPLRK